MALNDNEFNIVTTRIMFKMDWKLAHGSNRHGGEISQNVSEQEEIVSFFEQFENVYSGRKTAILGTEVGTK